MFSAIVVKEIRDSQSGNVYKVGDRVRVLEFSENQYIGTIIEIYGRSFIINPDGDETLILLSEVEKMRIADPEENFFNRRRF